MRLDWKRSTGGAWHQNGKGWIYKTGRYVLLAYVPLFEKSWYWSIRGPKFANGYESDDVNARNAAEMALDRLLEQDEERSSQPTALSPQPHKQPAIRIYFGGSDGTGKTSLADYVATAYGLPLLNEVARTVLAEGRKTFAAIRSTGATSSNYQRAVFERQLAEEARLQPPYVSDRTLDNLAYAAEHARNFGELLRSVPATYLCELRKSIVFLIRPQRSLRNAASVDPFRLLSEWEGQVRIDAIVETLFKLPDWDVPYVPIAEVDSSHREALVDWCLQARGFRKVAKCAI